MYKLFATAVLFASLSTSLYGTTFLSESESELIPATERPAGLVMVKEAFEQHSETPALVLSVQNVYGHELMVVERDGVKAILVDNYVFAKLINEDSGISERRKEKLEALADYCSSSCWDNTFGGALSGGLSGMGSGAVGGAAIGAGVGAYIGGAPGAGLGGFIGGGVGAVGGGVAGSAAGGIEAYNKCEKEKAETCSK